MVQRFLSTVLSALLVALPLHAARADFASHAASEFPAENQALIEATMAFFDKVEARATPRNRVPVIGIPLSATKSKATVQREDTEILTRMGPVDHLTGYRITWYPMDRLYGTVDFMGTWNGNRDLVCGYLTWDLSDPAAPKLEAVSASFVDIARLATASDQDIHASLLEANCAHGAIEANYRIFDVSG